MTKAVSNEFMEFPVRPLPLPGESLMGYCWRFFATNGHCLPVDIRVAAHSVRRLNAENVTDLIEQFAGTQTIAPMKADEEKFARTWFMGETRPKRLDVVKPRICPACVRAEGYYHLFWDLPLVRACPIHDCELLSRCPQCETNINWRTLQPGWRCQCGVVLADAPVSPARHATGVFSRLLAHAGDSVATPSERVATANDHPFGDFAYEMTDLYEVLTFTRRLRRVLTASNPWYPLTRVWGITDRRDCAFPNARELLLVANLPQSAFSKTFAVMERLFRDTDDVLVRPSDWRHFSAAMEFMQRSRRTKNPLIIFILEVAARVWRDLDAGIRTQYFLCFHPRVFHQREAHCQQLMAWWQTLAPEINSYAPQDSLACHADWAVRPDTSEATLTRLLNTLFRAAELQVPHDALRALTHRWQMPEELRHATTMQQLAQGFAKMDPAELTFVEALVWQGVEVVCGPSEEIEENGDADHD